MSTFKLNASFRFAHEDHVYQFHFCGEITVCPDPDDDPDKDNSDDDFDDDLDDFPDDFDDEDGNDPEGSDWPPINYN